MTLEIIIILLTIVLAVYFLFRPTSKKEKDRFKDKDNYRFLLDLNNKSNGKNQELISNKWFHGSIICTMCVPLYYFSIHISIVLFILFILLFLKS
jgi:uncharacterized membrane protein YfcA